MSTLIKIILGSIALLVIVFGVLFFLTSSNPTDVDGEIVPTLGDGGVVTNLPYANFNGGSVPTQVLGGGDAVDENGERVLLSKEGERIIVAPFLPVDDSKARSEIEGEGEVVWMSHSLFENDEQKPSSYEIEYLPPYAFSIILLEKPFAEVRRAAEIDLIERLQITEDIACRLDVMVVIPPHMEENFSGEDLGLSFCPGANPLFERN